MSATLGADLVFTIFAIWEMIVGRVTDRVLVAYQQAEGHYIWRINSDILQAKGTALLEYTQTCINSSIADNVEQGMILGRGTDRFLVAGDDWGPWWRQGHTSWQQF